MGGIVFLLSPEALVMNELHYKILVSLYLLGKKKKRIAYKSVFGLENEKHKFKKMPIFTELLFVCSLKLHNWRSRHYTC